MRRGILSVALVLSGTASLATGFSQQVELSRLLPQGARVAKVTPWARETNSTREGEAHAVFLNPWEHLATFHVVVMYIRGQDAVVGLYKRQPSIASYIKRWEQSSLGIEFDPISGVWDINGDGKTIL